MWKIVKRLKASVLYIYIYIEYHFSLQPLFYMLGLYFYVNNISYDKTHFTCNWMVLCGFKNIMKYFE